MGVCSSRLTKRSWYQHFRSSSVSNNNCVSGVVPQPERVCQARVATPGKRGPRHGLNLAHIRHRRPAGGPRRLEGARGGPGDRGAGN